MFGFKIITTLVVPFFYVITCSLASPAHPGHAFSVEVNRRGKKLTGPAGHHATLLKHGKVVPPELQAAAKNPGILVNGYKKACSTIELADLEKQKGSSQAYPIGDDRSYYAEFVVGKSKMNLFIDTGSSDLWVYTSQLPKNETQGHELYDPSSGTNLKGYSWNITYSGGASGASGIVYRDSVQVGSATATSQAIEAATSISGPHIVGQDSDGIVGLGFKPLNTIKPQKQPPLWQTLAPTLKQKVFAVDFNSRAPSSIDFGYLNSTRYHGPITYVPISPSYWLFNFTEYRFNGKTLAPNTHKDVPTSLIDTGTPFVLITTVAADAYYKHQKGAKRINGSWLVPCSTKLGDIGLKIGDRYFDVYGEYIKQPLREGICYGGVQGYSTQDYGDIIGEPFIVGNYIVFDGEKQRMGFAHKDIDSNGS